MAVAAGMGGLMKRRRRSPAYFLTHKTVSIDLLAVHMEDAITLSSLSEWPKDALVRVRQKHTFNEP